MKRVVENVIITIALNINRPHQINAAVERLITIKIVNFNCEIQLQISIVKKIKLNSKPKAEYLIIMELSKLN